MDKIKKTSNEILQSIIEGNYEETTDQYDSQTVEKEELEQLKKLSDKQICKIRENLEFELIDLDHEMRWVDPDEFNRGHRTIRDVEFDRDYVLYRIGQIETELNRRGIPDLWLKI